jgi:hypothetical protein
MTLIEALETLKGKGITKLVGMYNESNIDKYLDNAIKDHEANVRWADTTPTRKASLENEDCHYIIETNGHFIIATRYTNFDMATYGNYDTEKEMYADFDEYRINQQAEEIANQKVSESNDLPFEIWKAFAAGELRKAYAASHEAFEREFGNNEAVN